MGKPMVSGEDFPLNLRLRAVALMEGPSLVAAARLEEGIPKLPLGLANCEDVWVNEHLWRIHTCIYNYIYTLRLFNIAMENGPFIDGLPIKNGGFPWLC
jgi:hypothetical protein